MAEHNVDEIWKSLEKNYPGLLEDYINCIGKQELGLIINKFKREIRQEIKRKKDAVTRNDFKRIFEREFGIGKYADKPW